MANTPANPGRSRKSTKSRTAATRAAPSRATTPWAAMIAPNTATPIALPSVRKNAIVAVAIPMSRGSTAFCTETVAVENKGPTPSPRQNTRISADTKFRLGARAASVAKTRIASERPQTGARL